MSSKPTVPRTYDPSTESRPSQDPKSRRVPDLNRPLPRPLPPPPQPASSLPNRYDIPTLLRKPYPDSPSSGPVNHTRSISHPFPSFFGGRKVDKGLAERQPYDEVESSDSTGHGRDNNFRSKQPATSAQPSSAKNDRQPITGKCMTCDSTVRWPQGLKVFRCTTCLTINDLEPVDYQSPAEIGRYPPVLGKPIPISLERTRKIIDHCINEYLEQILDREHRENDLADSPVESFLLGDGDPPEGLLYNELEAARENQPLPSMNASFRQRDLSDPRRAPMGRNWSEGKSRLPKQMHQSSAVNNLSTGPGRLNPTQIAFDDRQSAVPNEDPSGIFRTAESYISGCCNGCTSFNTSFFNVKPSQIKDDKPVTKGHMKRQASEHMITPQNEPDIFLSELDAKTLLLGDVVENGSWWTGNRVVQEGISNDDPRDRSPERWRGIVSGKTPRINWAEIGEWYRIILNAGSDWRIRWQEMRPQAPGSLQKKWDSISLNTLQQEISESQIHLQRALLKATENLLKRPKRPLKAPEDCRFLLMVFANPLLHPSSLQNQGENGTGALSSDNGTRPLRMPSDPKISPNKNGRPSKRPGGLGHHSGIVKRILGLLANLPNEIHQILVSWFARLPDFQFQKLVDIISVFVTYRLTRQSKKPVQQYVDPTEGLIPSFSDSGVRHASQLHAALDIRSNSSSARIQDGKPKMAIYAEDWQIRAAARVMALLFQANTGHIAKKRDTSISAEQRLRNAGLNAKHQAHVHGQIIPVSCFYNSLLDHGDLIADFEAWETTKTKFTFCQYPFFLSIWAKIHILEHDARRQMEVKAREAFFDSILSRKAVSQYLVLKVRRDCLVEDSLKSVSGVIGAGSSDIKKGLRIDFVGEEGVDAGGLRKEWFLLLVREIFNPHHGLFVYDDDSQYCYFNPFCFESSEQFFLVGVLVGLAIYNSTILDVAFPPFVFKKMLASAPSTGEKLTSTPKIVQHYTLEDLAEFRPALARGLRQLLEFEGDVQETFCRDFVAEVDRYGEVVQVSLGHGGEKRAVTNSNRKEFVDLYVQYLLDSAVVRQYEPFKRGFFTVCGGNALSLFRPEEIELLVRGSDEPLDVSSLRAVASYDGWPKTRGGPEEQPQVVWFWDFFARASPIDQRKLLGFITGSDRIPAMGATNLSIRIQLLVDKEATQRGIDPQRFPTARTCFNQLSLYQYRRRETLESKLWMAVTGSEGFGLK